MPEVSTNELRKAVESQHGGTATFIQSVPVREKHDDAIVWDGIVHLFRLENNPTARLAYAWSYELPDGKRRFFAVLHVPPITSPARAVQAAIVAEAKSK